MFSVSPHIQAATFHFCKCLCIEIIQDFDQRGPPRDSFAWEAPTDEARASTTEESGQSSFDGRGVLQGPSSPIQGLLPYVTEYPVYALAVPCLISDVPLCDTRTKLRQKLPSETFSTNVRKLQQKVAVYEGTAHVLGLTLDTLGQHPILDKCVAAGKYAWGQTRHFCRIVVNSQYFSNFILLAIMVCSLIPFVSCSSCPTYKKQSTTASPCLPFFNTQHFRITYIDRALTRFSNVDEHDRDSIGSARPGLVRARNLPPPLRLGPVVS